MVQIRKKKFDLQHSFVEELKKNGKISGEALRQIQNLSIEELLSVKLELAANSLGVCYCGFPIWNSLFNITEKAIYNSAVNICTSRKEIKEFLGVTEKQLCNIELRLRENCNGNEKENLCN